MATVTLTDRQTYTQTQTDTRGQHKSLNSTEAVFLVVSS